MYQGTHQSTWNLTSGHGAFKRNIVQTRAPRNLERFHVKREGGQPHFDHSQIVYLEEVSGWMAGRLAGLTDLLGRLVGRWVGWLLVGGLVGRVVGWEHDWLAD